MTAYHGGKQRIGKEIASIITTISHNIKSQYSFQITGYCEPFCGMLGVFSHMLIDKHYNYKAGDILCTSKIAPNAISIYFRRKYVFI